MTDVLWAGLLSVTGGAVVVGLGLEAYALWSKRQGDTLSEFIRPWARQHRGLFVAVCGLLVGLGVWLPGHILG
ncbi:hypothetical protein [Streptomyces cupreus]|uniref:Uncharacterized protein n=1 Tax=Streptomyces cupreus TaxID=2759956 RepID=A0A7X1MBZ1_9ACTN|nr:hypothetical protein [Streptomyces cupreus]MBC2903130.1 hypothetical protein [Streptomyces cupreus]